MNTVTEKACTHCGSIQPAIEFYPDRKNKNNGLHSWCKTCMRARKQPTKRQPSGYYRKYKLRAYGLSERGFDSLLAAQDGRCALCGTASERLVIDHDHATGKVRGLLCVTCNAALGPFEKAGWAPQARAYLAQRSPRFCPECGDLIRAKRSDAKVCGPNCRSARRRPRSLRAQNARWAR